MSERQDWGTPMAFMRYLEESFAFYPTLDAAASATNTKAGRYFSIVDDSLNQDWFGNVWLNPPFGAELPKFLEKCSQEIRREEVNRIITLIPARTDTKWFHEIVLPSASVVYLIKGRFNFVSPGAVEGANAPFPSMLVIWDRFNYGDGQIQTLDPGKVARGFK